MRILAQLSLLSLPVLSLSATPVTAVEPVAAGVAQPAIRLKKQDHEALRCAAAFAIIASEQASGLPSALEHPPLGYRGKAYFVATSERIMTEAALTREALRDLLTDEARTLQNEAGADPDGAIAKALGPCLSLLDAVVPPLEKPDLLQCTAILKVAYEEVHAREGLSPAARDLATLAAVLTAREKEALQAAGASGDMADRKIAEAHDKLVADVQGGEERAASGVEKYDIAHCYDLAKPEPKSHY